ncbi:MAG: hypothetical protein COU27_00895 [Candidatus Levybacteria bacterium CG10_big_fil_rev_8_21_14_0_10_36_7]|nr:MAG: hypothetical protein COU27_00895 [Candidatus Levybacteria bacterium CG10_big_fil_rev_8_21_14_0_10_36_7]
MNDKNIEQNNNINTNQKNVNNSVSVAIVIAGIVIAGAIIFTSKNPAPINTTVKEKDIVSKLATSLKIDEVELRNCVDNNVFADKVQGDQEDAVANGAQGTPFFVITDNNGNKYIGGGAMPYLDPEDLGRGLKDMLDDILNKTAKSQTLSGPKAISDDDYVLGNPDAPLTFYIYDDLVCPYCQRFNSETKKMMADYGQQGKIKMVFRHFPLDGLHPEARLKAEAVECAGKIGGEEKFWQGVDFMFENQ